ncbi:hypothetical protein LRS13_15945 [Svornostia abyssi]|uniref:Uncharacterized protein n=1 Tax=Svornostia abyssi TaxID=2898438 RepID=A0ABY5PC63_9ACTN|nr:hypothetical protein LRS13_15945 [Parviterribacteraceae bacterium J379]
MNCGCEPEPEVARGLSWFEATYRFAPLRNALIAGLLLALGVVLELLDVPEVIAIASFVAAIPVGAWFFAKEGWEEFMEEREIGIEALMLIAAARLHRLWPVEGSRRAGVLVLPGGGDRGIGVRSHALGHPRSARPRAQAGPPAC